jgi:hypothetical protein
VAERARDHDPLVRKKGHEGFRSAATAG